MDSSSAAPRVAIVGNDDPTFVEDLRASLQGAGIRSRVFTVSTLKLVTRAPDLTLIVGDAVHDGGVAVLDEVGEDRGPFAVVLAAGSLSVRLEARTRGLSVIPRPDDGASLGQDVERMLDSAGVSTDVAPPRMALNPGAPVADLDWEDDSETIQHVEAEAATDPERPAEKKRESLPAIGSGPSGLGRVVPRREIGYRTTLQGLSPGDQDVTVAASESTTEALQDQSSRPDEERHTQPESRRSTKPDPRNTRPAKPPEKSQSEPALRPSADARRRSTVPESRRRRSTRPARRKALPEEETRMVAHPTAPLEEVTRAQARPRGTPSSETRMVPDPKAPLYQEATAHAGSSYTQQLAEAMHDPDATSPHRSVTKPARKPTSRPSERPSARPSKPTSDLPPSAAPKRPSTPPRTSQPPPRGVRALDPPVAETPSRPDTAKLASPGRAAPPTSPSAPTALPIPLLPKPPQPVDNRYSKPPPPAKPPARSRPELQVVDEASDTGAPIPLLPERVSAPSMAVAAPAPQIETPARSARWPMVLAAVLVVGSLAGAAAWVLLPLDEPASPGTPVGSAPEGLDEPVVADEPAPVQTARTAPVAPDATEPAVQPPSRPAPAVDEPPPVEGPVDVHVQMREGRRHLRGRRWDEARLAFTRVLSQGENPDAHEGLAEVALAQENAEAALQHAEAAVSLRRTRARYHRLLGDARRLGGDDPGARRAYERALSLDPEDEAAERLSEM